jgi:hypothetical protein
MAYNTYQSIAKQARKALYLLEWSFLQRMHHCKLPGGK